MRLRDGCTTDASRKSVRRQRIDDAIEEVDNKKLRQNYSSGINDRSHSIIMNPMHCEKKLCEQYILEHEKAHLDDVDCVDLTKDEEGSESSLTSHASVSESSTSSEVVEDNPFLLIFKKDKHSLHPQLLTLKSALSAEDVISDNSWFTSTIIDIILLNYAISYPSVHFLASDFVPLHLESAVRNNQLSQSFPIFDILGRRICYDSLNPIVFVANIGHIHWNLFRVQHVPTKELQLFEPMGKPRSRNGVSSRSVPRQVIEWLDICFPDNQSWLRKTVSAITKQHQYSGFDCGVACLLYAQKCGQGQIREDINEWTDQVDITSFRKQLQLQLEAYQTAYISGNSSR